jgi:hypothetical protein
LRRSHCGFSLLMDMAQSGSKVLDGCLSLGKLALDKFSGGDLRPDGLPGCLERIVGRQ